MRTAEVLAVGGVLAGAAWWLHREHQRERAAKRTAKRLVELATAGATEPAPHTPDATPPPASMPPPEPAPPAPADRDASAPAAAPTARPGGAAPEAPALTHAFDPIFAAEGRGLPVAYLRALAHAESGLRPDSRLGLINVVSVALEDYNRRHPQARVTASDMHDPRINVRVAADILRAIIASYRRNHPDVRNLAEDWRNPRFVELLTAGWNGGFSERGGVGRVVRFLRSRPVSKPGGDDVTVDAVFAAASAAGATRHLSNPAKLEFAKRVARTYAREVERDAVITTPTA